MTDLFYKINEFIIKEWIPKYPSNRKFAKEHLLDERTVRSIINHKSIPYRISLSKLKDICDEQNITLSEFFKLIDE